MLLGIWNKNFSLVRKLSFIYLFKKTLFSCKHNGTTLVTSRSFWL